MYINENHDNWDDILPDLQFAYRTSRIEGMSFSPFEIIYGRKAKLPSDVLYGSPSKIRVDVNKYNLLLTKRLRQTFKKVREERKKIKHATKVRYDFSQTHVEFKKGDLVLLFMPQGDYRGPSRKLRPKFTRPNRVLKKFLTLIMKLKMQFRAENILFKFVECKNSSHVPELNLKRILRKISKHHVL